MPLQSKHLHPDEDKTREELIAELGALRLRLKEPSNAVLPRELLRSLIDSIPHSIFGKDRQGRFIFANRQHCDHLGLPLEKIIGKTDFDVHPPEAAERYRRDDLKVIESGELLRQVEEFNRLDGQSMFTKVIKAPIVENGTTIGILGVFWDVTEQQRAERALRQSEERYRELVENAANVILRLNPQGDITFINGHGAKTFQYAKEELLGQSILDVIIPGEGQDGQDIKDKIRRIVETPEAYPISENENVRKDGSRIWLRWTNTAILDDDGSLLETLCIGTDITEQVNVMKALEETTLRAQVASHAKSEFLAVMSHEIRTPMNTILGMAELLSETPLGSEQSQMLSLLQQSGNHLVTLIDDILDITRIEAGKLELNFSEVPVREFIESCMDVVRPDANQKGLALSTTVEDAIPLLLVCDKTRLRQILLNLLGNAVKFTHEGSVSLAVALDQGKNMIRFEISDTGIGIPEDMREYLFTPFTQGDSSITRKYGGVGLGLSISRKLAAVMSGYVSLAANIPEGTVATLTLPLKYDAPSISRPKATSPD